MEGKQAGVKCKDEEWTTLLYSMPEMTNWELDEYNQTMTIFWCENGEEQHEGVPLSEFYDDEQPNLEMLWHCNYYDGPLSGMAKYDGEYVWFKCTYEDDYGDSVYTLYELDNDAYRELQRQHDIFREMVGHHVDHHPDTWSTHKCEDREIIKKYYDEVGPNFPEVDATKGKVLGTAHWYEFKYYARPHTPC